MTSITLYDEATGEDKGTITLPSDVDGAVFVPVNE